MQNELDILNKKEAEIMDIVFHLKGRMEEMLNAIEIRGLSNEYKEIHKKYSDLATDNLEALKRALFIQWYSVMEPECFTGIGNLDIQLAINNIIILENYISNNLVDPELDQMITYYYAITDWYFQKYKSCTKLQNYLEKKIDISLEEIKFSKMVGRGQMGHYWNSVSSK